MDLDKGHLESIYENICEKRKSTIYSNRKLNKKLEFQ